MNESGETHDEGSGQGNLASTSVSYDLQGQSVRAGLDTLVHEYHQWQSVADQAGVKLCERLPRRQT